MRIVSAGCVGPLAQLEPLACAIFGEGDRPDGWFARKLHRECVDASLSRLVIDGDERVGYALAGRPPSLPGTVRTAGIGLVPAARGRGFGRALVEALVEAAATAGFARVRIPAPPPLTDFYGRFGFEVRCHAHTLLHFGRGEATSIAFGHPQPRIEFATVTGWLPEAWDRTDAALRASVEIAGAFFELAREGKAIVVHRCAAPPGVDVVAACDALRDRVEIGVPLIVVHSDPVSSVTANLDARGWTVVQEAVLLELDLDNGTKAVDDPRR